MAFVFNGDFLDSFKVLAFSLLRTGSFIDSPVYIFSEQAPVLQDPLVKLIADRAVLLSDEMITQFQNISRRRIAKRNQLSWIPKYTFLKWNIFDDTLCDRLLFIDADVIAVNCVESILSAAQDADLAFSPSMNFRVNQKSDRTDLPFRRVEKNLKAMIEGHGKIFDQHARINSGVLLLGKKLLDRNLRSELIEYARDKSSVNEQSYLTGFFTRNPDRFRMQPIGSRFNFGASYLETVPAVHQLQLLSKIVLLHFPGIDKPWQGSFREESRFAHMLWRKVRADAEAASPLFHRNHGRPGTIGATTISAAIQTRVSAGKAGHALIKLLKRVRRRLRKRAANL